MTLPTLPTLSDETAHTPGRAALRALGYGLLIDVAVAIILTLAVAFDDIRWTAVYWGGLGLTLAKTVLQTGVAYLVRRFVTPYLADQHSR